MVASQTSRRRHSSTSDAKRVNVSACSRLRRLPPETASSPRSSASTPSIAGTAAASTSAARPLAAVSSCRCPSNPNPVTSVIACAPASRAARAAVAFSAVIVATAGASSPSPWPRLSAVEIAPTPSGFVSTSASPACPPALLSTRAGSTTPVTARPYFGSGSSIEWPPTSSAPASRTTSPPPRRISPSTAGPSRSSGNATRFSALKGSAPIA